MTDAAVQREVQGGLTLLRLSRPALRNALTDEVKAHLGEFIPAFFADPTARCLLVTGTGDAFCAGGDLRGLAKGASAAQTRARMDKSHSWAHGLLTGEKPVIMAVNGVAAGAGFGLALLGDIILAADSASFLPGFASVGVAADMGVTLTLPRAVGAVRAKEILFRNRRVSAVEAERLGLVSSVHPKEELLATAIALGAELASGPTLGLGLTKTLIRRSYEMPLDAYFSAETAAQMLAFSSVDCMEGVSAFFEKRKPRFTGA